ncbi:hypothetical protein ACKLNO_03610 [Neisseriaceae bacterium B1]
MAILRCCCRLSRPMRHRIWRRRSGLWRLWFAGFIAVDTPRHRRHAAR